VSPKNIFAEVWGGDRKGRKGKGQTTGQMKGQTKGQMKGQMKGSYGMDF